MFSGQEKLDNLFVFCSFFHIFSAQVVTVFEGYEFEGKQANISILSCSNLPSSLTKNVASVKTHNHCVRLYDEISCTGNFIEISPLAPSHEDLWYWNFDDKAVSAGPCPQLCSTESVLKSTENIVVNVFNQTEFKGSRHVVHIRGCTKLPGELIYSTKSVQTKGQCVQLYSNDNCKLEPGSKTMIKLLPGTPHHDNLTFWGLPVTYSISDCTYSSRRFGNLYFYPSTYFTGSPVVLNASTNCQDILAKRISLSGSVILSSISCVTLFSKPNCTGTQLKVKATTFDLSISKFYENIESIVSCQEKVTTTLVGIASSSIPNHTQLNSNGTNTELKSSGGFPLHIITTIVVPVASVLLSLFIILIVLRRWHLYKTVIEKLSEKEIQEFLDGLGIDMLSNRRLSVDNEYSTELLAQNKAYNQEYEIARHRIEIDSEAILGKGQFGVVYKGTVTVNFNDAQTTISVAIKMANASSGLQGLRSLLKEIKVMLYVGEHRNIARIVGCCTDNLRQGELMVLVEFCSKGSLESYLVKNRHSFENIVKHGRLEWTNKIQEDRLDYSVSTTFNIFLLAKWCADVASGMEFLSKCKVVHSDLAARNVLLDDKLEAKISDFGLSRQLYTYSEYLKKQQEPLPLRWMALESLKCLEFSTKSDVWSYGVLCWEMFTLGEKPYPNLGWNEEFVTTLEDGFRLSQPKNATNELYSLMRSCWEQTPSLRPSFGELVVEIKEIILNYETIKCIPDAIETLLIS